MPLTSSLLRACRRWVRLALAVCVVSFAASAVAEQSPYNKGVEAWRAKDYAEARRQWRISLSQGGPDEALNNLAYLLYHGLGGPQDRPRAVELWRKGAALAVSEAQFHLGNAYEQGAGVAKSLSQAYAWYKCSAATAGRLSRDDATEREIEAMANEAIAKLLPRLSPLDLAEGEARARDLVARYSVPLQAGQR